MLDSFLTIFGTPQQSTTTSNVAANVTIHNTSESSCPHASRTHLASNSTVIDYGIVESSNVITNEISSSISPVKCMRENSMSSSASVYSSSSSYECSDQNISLQLKHSTESLNFDDPSVQKFTLHYLLDKVKNLETLFIDSAKEKESLQEEVKALYQQNDVLSAENITLKELITGQQKDHEKLEKEVEEAKNMFAADKSNLGTFLAMNHENLAAFLSTNNDVITRDFENLNNDLDFLNNDLEYLNDRYKTLLELWEKVENVDLVDIRNTIAKNSNDIVRLDTNITMTNQYNRRQNLIIEGIPDNIPQNKLETICLDIIHDIGFSDVSSYEVVACHRLRRREGDSTSPTIIRFINRKITEFCLKNRWRLQHLQTNWVLKFREDLCDNNLEILSKCEKLLKEGKIAKVFTFNGFVKIVHKNQRRSVKITHISDLEYMGF